MGLRYEISVDVASLPIIGAESTPGLAVRVTEDSGGTPAQSQISIATGVHTHTDISTVDSSYTPFGAALKTVLDADATLTGTYTVTWGGTTGYTIVNDLGTTLDLEFSAATTTEHGTNLRRLLGFSGDQTGATGTTGYASNVRPYYMTIPAIGGRSQYQGARGRPDFAEDAEADDGSSVFIAKGTGVRISTWNQVGEIETVPGVFSDLGTPPYKHMVDAGTAANDVPWAWEHFYEHASTAEHRISVLDGSAHEVWELQAAGMFFDPTRWTGEDQPLWQVPFIVRLIGRV